MKGRKTSIEWLLQSLQERAKELECYYAVQDALNVPDVSLDEICGKLIEVIPPGWQHPETCRVRISIGASTYSSPDFAETPWSISADILTEDRVVGFITVAYAEQIETETGGPFLDDETRLLRTIARRVGAFLSQRLKRKLIEDWNATVTQVPRHERSEWQTALDTIRDTNHELYQNISRKMLNHLCWTGVPEAEQLLRSFWPAKLSFEDDDYISDWNSLGRDQGIGFASYLGARVFAVAEENLDGDQILKLIQTWIREDKLSFLVQLIGPNVPMSQVAEIVRRYHEMLQEPSFVPTARSRGVLISLIRRFLSEQTGYVDVIKELITIDDFYDLLEKSIYGPDSHGRLGGKSAGLYLATQIIHKKGPNCPELQGIKIPKTWYIPSDVFFHFIHHSNFDELIEQKYKPSQQVRQEYPCILQAFKSVSFPPDITRGLSAAVDDFGTRPIIVRSSSLLEDSIGAAFSGKYKSLFLANQGSKRHRLQELTDAVAEVYASSFSPDPIEYRADRGLLDYNEEMGVLIQEVVGKKVGRYFLPAFAGVAFSCNEYRWSPRIKPEDGLVRMVPGLGTRAVDRLSDDYPVLISPGRPNLRTNVTPDEVLRYSPRMIDVINLEKACFESIDIEDFLKEAGDSFGPLKDIFSVYRTDHIGEIPITGIDFETDKPLATFNGLISRKPFVKQMKMILKTLEDTMGYPVDIEFASDGDDLYLLQCRPQSSSGRSTPASIPINIPRERIIFTVLRHVSNGLVPNISHIVYVRSQGYHDLSSRSRMVDVGRAVSKLNRLLPRRQFILMGPGRWGSRGDIRLGVSVDYSDINNTSMLVEIARQKGEYVPELSFGTHFFQDLVEAQIKYLPLYPDEADTVFNEEFLTGTHNLLSELVPEHADLADVIRVIDIPASTDGMYLSVAMNADLNQAMGYLQKPTDTSAGKDTP